MRLPLKIATGIDSDDTIYEAEGRWADADKARFYLANAQVIGGWESLTTMLLTGVCRTIFPWTDNSAVLDVMFATHSALQVWQGGSLYDITPFGPATLLGPNPLSVTNTSAVVSVTHTAHGRTTGDSVAISGAVAVGGVTPNGTFPITVVNANTYTYTFTSAATSTAVGGGSAVIETPQVLLPPGAIDGTGSVGYGTGAFGNGVYGQTSPATDFFPRTWSAGAWGQQLLASPRNGGLYLWQNDIAARAAIVPTAPTQVTYTLVAPMNGGYMAFALGCNQEADGVFNPMNIRHCSVRDLSTWSTLASGSTAREYTLTGGGRIVAGRMIGPYLAVWTNDSLWVGTFTGALDVPWSFQRQGTKCGLIGPNAAVVVGQTAYWVSPDGQFFAYGLGGSPEPIICPERLTFAANLALGQGDKVVASSNAKYSEVRFDYPDSRDGFENSRYVSLAVGGVDIGKWSAGVMARTGFTDAGLAPYPLAATFAGNAYYQEKGQTADGSAIAWSITSAAQLLDVNYRLQINGIWPDFAGQVGSVTVTVFARDYPQGPETSVSATMAAGATKADFRVSGRIFRVQFAGNSTPAAARLGRPVFDVEQVGQR